MTILTDLEINEILAFDNVTPNTLFNSDHDDFLPLFLDTCDESFDDSIFVQEMYFEVA